MLATTATANARVTADVAEQLGTPARRVLAGRSTGTRSARRGHAAHRAHRLGWLAARLPGLPGSGIVYA